MTLDMGASIAAWMRIPRQVMRRRNDCRPYFLAIDYIRHPDQLRDIGKVRLEDSCRRRPAVGAFVLRHDERWPGDKETTMPSQANV